MKLDLLTNATVVDDAIRFTKELQDKPVVSKEAKNGYSEFNEPYYDNNKNKAKEELLEDEQRYKTGGIRNATN